MMPAAPSLTDTEREAHIASYSALMLAAHERGDIAEARVWMQLQNTAILARSEALQAARHREFERRVEEGGCYFAEAGELSRDLMGLQEAARG